MDTRTENLKAELRKIGINNEEDLREAMKKLPPLKLNMMICPIVQKDA